MVFNNGSAAFKRQPDTLRFSGNLQAGDAAVAMVVMLGGASMRLILRRYHDLADGLDGVFVLFAKIPDSKMRRIQQFEIGDVDGMMAAALDLSAIGYNVWFAPVVMRRGLKPGERGGYDDIIAVLALVVDDDCDKAGKSATLPAEHRKPTFTVKTSITGDVVNRQLHFVFDRPLSPEEAGVLAGALRTQGGGDDCTAVTAQVYALPDTQNHPTAAKIKRGRAPEPQMRSLESIGELHDPDQLADLLREPKVADSNFSQGDATAERQPELGKDATRTVYLPDDIVALIEKGKPKGERSEVIFRVLLVMLSSGIDEPTIMALMMNPHHRISEKPREKGREWLKGEIARARAWLKVVPADFYANMSMHNYYFIPTMEPWPAASVNSRLRPIEVGKAVNGKIVRLPASQWLDQHRPVEATCWVPGAPQLIEDRFLHQGGWSERQGVRSLNLYRPPNIEHGDATKAEPWLDLLKKLFPDDYEHLTKYMAHRVQRPGEKPNHALLLGGSPGIGKDTLLAALRHAVGPWNFIDVSPQHMLGNNNDFVKSTVLRVNETRDLGDINRYAFYDHMKTYTAAPPEVIRCNEKHIRQYYVLNVCAVIYTTNHKVDGMYLPADDRRHYVAWSNQTKKDFKETYWTELWAWYERGGFGHVGAYLKSVDLTGFDAKAPPPKTPAFWEIVNANRAPEATDMASVLDWLGNPDAVTLDMLIDATYRMPMHSFGSWLEDRKNRRTIPHRFAEAGYSVVVNASNKDGQWKIGGRNRMVYAKIELSEVERIKAVGRVRVTDPKPKKHKV